MYLDVWVALHDLFDARKGKRRMFDIWTLILGDGDVFCPETGLESEKGLLVATSRSASHGHVGMFKRNECGYKSDN